MKLSTILLIGIVILTLINIVTAQPDIGLANNDHYFIVGHIYEPYSEDNIVIITNVRTGEQLNEIAIDCEHGVKVYLFNLANLHQGWNNKDEMVITYHNNSTSIIIDDSMTGIQVDLNAPEGYNPIPIIAGTLILSACGSYYYIRRKKGNKEVTTLEEETPSKQTGFKLFRDFGVRALISTLLIIGCIISVLYAMYLNNSEMIKSIAAVYGPAITAVIVFYFNDRSRNT